MISSLKLIKRKTVYKKHFLKRQINKKVNFETNIIVHLHCDFKN